MSHTTVQNDLRDGKKLPAEAVENPLESAEIAESGNKLPTPDPLINLSADDVQSPGRSGWALRQ